MSIYSIDFTGHYPIGAVAVVSADSEESAKELFLLQLAKEEPYLVESNATKGAIVVTKLPFTTQPCYIITNGNY